MLILIVPLNSSAVPPGEPQITPSKPIAHEGEPFTLTCSSVGGSPDPMISWSRDGQPLNTVTRLGKSKDVPTSSILTIDPTMEDDLSTYKCVIWNRAVREIDNREYEKDVLLEVNCKYSIQISLSLIRFLLLFNPHTESSMPFFENAIHNQFKVGLFVDIFIARGVVLAQ